MAAVLNDGLNGGGFDLTRGGFDGGFDHGEGEPFDAVAKELQVAQLVGLQPRIERWAIQIALQQGTIPLLGHRKDRFVVPERIVAIKGDHGNHRKSPTNCTEHGGFRAAMVR
jgi:hypothetical protein